MFTSDTLATWTGGRLPRAQTFEVEGFITDTRARRGPRDMFVALSGPNFDGHDFLGDVTGPVLLARGAHAPSHLQDILEVEDPLVALQEIAARHRLTFPELELLGITGSNGKTIVKDMLSSVVSRTRTTHRSPGSFNSQIGVALSLLGLRPEHALAMIEAGISRPGEMERHAHMVAPSCGVLTNIGEAHLAGLGTLEVTAREKLRLFHGARWVVMPWSDPHIDEDQMLPAAVRRVYFGVTEGDPGARPGVVAYGLEEDIDGWSFSMRFRTGESGAFRLRAPGRHNVANAAAAAAAAHELGCSISQIRRGLAAFELKPMRLEVHTTPDGVTLLNDTYSSDPTSARAALDALSHHAGSGRVIAILGDMLDLGARGRAEHEALGRHLWASVAPDVLITLGEQARAIGETAVAVGMSPDAVHHRSELESLHGLLATTLRHGDTVLLKASGALGLDRAAARLLESMGPTRLEIDLDAVRQNYHALRVALGPEVAIMPVVKSFAYGNDATRVSLTLVREGATALAVAYADEGVALRRQGLELPILVTNASAWEADKLTAHKLTALVYSRDVVAALAAHSRALGVPVDVHVEVDTGMNRAGLQPEEVAGFARWISGVAGVHVRGVMTHFAVADDPAQDAFTREQHARFERAVEEIRAAGLRPDVLHAANTAAAWRMPEARHDMVRVGIGLYGIAPSADVVTPGTRLALRFTTRVLHLKTLPQGATLGYGRTWVAKAPTRVATIAAGYNDGFPRFLSNRGEVLLHGVRCPVIGSVCMDVAMVDVSALSRVAVGDEVVLFGSQGSETLAIEELAALGSTISYELLCNISPRVRRVFLRA